MSKQLSISNFFLKKKSPDPPISTPFPTPVPPDQALASNKHQSRDVGVVGKRERNNPSLRVSKRQKVIVNISGGDDHDYHHVDDDHDFVESTNGDERDEEEVDESNQKHSLPYHRKTDPQRTREGVTHPSQVGKSYVSDLSPSPPSSLSTGGETRGPLGTATRIPNIQRPTGKGVEQLQQFLWKVKRSTSDPEGECPQRSSLRSVESSSLGSTSSSPAGSPPRSPAPVKKGLVKSSGEGRKDLKKKLTPLEQQVADIWDQQPGLVLAVECGYRFRFFGKDAEIVSKILNIMFVPAGDQTFPSASIPTHRLGFHLRRIVKAGYKVGVVRQTETAAIKAAGANKGGPFERRLTQVYTRATLIAEDIDPYETTDRHRLSSTQRSSSLDITAEEGSGEEMEESCTPLIDHVELFSQDCGSDYILCLSESSLNTNHQSAADQVTVSWIALQPSTGDIIWDQHKDDFLRSELETRLTHLRPCEILVPTTDLSDQSEKVILNFCDRFGSQKQEKADVLTILENMKEMVVRLERVEVPSHDESLLQISNLYQNILDKEEDGEKVGGEITTATATAKAGLNELLKLPTQVMRCVAMLINYLKLFQLETVLQLHRNIRCFSSSTSMILDKNALRNLDVLQCQETGKIRGSLFWILNQTLTPFGARLMSRWISHPLLDRRDILQRQDAVAEIIQLLSFSGSLVISGKKSSRNNPNDGSDGSDGSSQVSDVQGNSSSSCSSSLGGGGGDGGIVITRLKQTLSKVGDLERGLLRIYYRKASPREFFLILSSFQEMSQNLPSREQVMHFFSSEMLRKLLADLPDLVPRCQYFLNMIQAEAAAINDKASLFVDEERFPDIRAARLLIKEAKKNLDEGLYEIRQTLGLSSLKYEHRQGSGEYLIELTPSQAKKVPKSWTHINSTKKIDRYQSPTTVDLLSQLNQGRELLILASKAAWQAFLEEFTAQYYHFKSAVANLANLDCILSLAMVAASHDYCRPEIVATEAIKDSDLSQYSHNEKDCNSNDNQIVIIEGRNPIVEQLISEQFVVNDTDLRGDSRSYILTGPNMGGKSCYIRQVALIVLMAQVGSFVPAKQARISPIDKILVRMGAHDSLYEGKSTFMVEMQETSMILQQATHRSLVILDELGRGTSTHDGAAIAWASLHYCINSCRCFTLFVTHYHLLCSAVALFPEKVTNFHMAFFDEELETSEDSAAVASLLLPPPAPILAPIPRNLGSRVIFLYKLRKGMAHCSFGLNVARLAGIPTSVLEVAQEKSREMESTMKVIDNALVPDCIQSLLRITDNCHLSTEQKIDHLVTIQEVLRIMLAIDQPNNIDHHLNKR